MGIVRAAMTQTINAYSNMPERIEDLPFLRDRLEDLRHANVDHHLQLVDEAATRGVAVIGLGELFTAPYFALSREPMWHALAESATDGPTVTALRGAARRHQMVIVAPIYELDGSQRFNTAVIIDADGSVRGCYRKVHIPHGRNEAGEFDETFYYQASDAPPGGLLPVFATAVGTIGVATCYDRHFEGVVRGLAAAGAALIFSPAVTFGEKSHRLWQLEFPVDAARHRVFIGGSNRAGSEPPWNCEYFGDSYFVGPGGRCENRSDHARLIIADLDLSSLDEPDPAGWDLWRDARRLQ